MMAVPDVKVRPANSHKLWWCEDCNAQFSENTGQWARGWDMAEGTEPPKFLKSRGIPAGVCINCESKNIHKPIN